MKFECVSFFNQSLAIVRAKISIVKIVIAMSTLCVHIIRYLFLSVKNQIISVIRITVFCQYKLLPFSTCMFYCPQQVVTSYSKV